MLPHALAAPPRPFPPLVGPSPAGSRFWLLAGKVSDEDREGTPSSTFSGTDNSKYYSSTASIDVDQLHVGDLGKKVKGRKKRKGIRRIQKLQNDENGENKVEEKKKLIGIITKIKQGRIGGMKKCGMLDVCN